MKKVIRKRLTTSTSRRITAAEMDALRADAKAIREYFNKRKAEKDRNSKRAIS